MPSKRRKENQEYTGGKISFGKVASMAAKTYLNPVGTATKLFKDGKKKSIDMLQTQGQEKGSFMKSFLKNRINPNPLKQDNEQSMTNVAETSSKTFVNTTNIITPAKQTAIVDKSLQHNNDVEVKQIEPVTKQPEEAKSDTSEQVTKQPEEAKSDTSEQVTKQPEEAKSDTSEQVTKQPEEAKSDTSEQVTKQSETPDTNKDDPIQKMKGDLSDLIKQQEETLVDTKLNADTKVDKIRSLQSQIQKIQEEAKLIEDALDKKDDKEVSKSDSQPTSDALVKKDDKESNKNETPATSEQQSKQSGGADPDLSKMELELIQQQALINIIKADVKIVLENVGKTNDPRALKVLFKYQQGSDKKEDILSKHQQTVNELIIDPDTNAKLRKNLIQLRQDLKIAHVKLLSLNIESLIQKIENQESDVNFFPDELKTEMTDEQKKITSTILAIYAIIKYIVKQFGKAPTRVTVLTLLSLLTLVISAFFAFKYVVSIVLDYANNQLINNPTNGESLDFIIGNFGNGLPRKVKDGEQQGRLSANLIRVSSNPIVAFFVDILKKRLGPLFSNLMTAKYKYAIFVILPWISIAFAIAALVVMIQRRKQMELTPGIVQVVLYACFTQAFIALIMNSTVFYYAYRELKATSFRIDSYNKFVLKNTIQKADFLTVVQKVPTNAISISAVTNDALATLFKNNKNPTAKDLAQAMFTLNLYEHYQQLGFRNPILYDALDTFRIYSFIFSKQNFSPALYLRRRSTLIRDNSEKYRSKIGYILQRVNRTLDARIIDEAIISSASMTAEANNLANSFFPEDAMTRFLHMAVIIAVVQFLPLLLFIHLFRQKDLRDGFINALRVIFGQKKDAENADLYDQESEIQNLREMMKQDKVDEKDKEKNANVTL